MKWKFIIINFFVVGLIVSVVGAVFYNYNEINKILTKQVYSHLETTAQSRAHHIETFLEEEKQEVRILSNDVIFEELFMVDKSSPEYSERYERLKKQINNIMEIDGGIHELFVIDKTGKIVLSDIEENIGLDKSNDSYFIYGKEKIYIKDAYYSKTIRKKIITISSPILDDKTDEFLGVVVMRMGLIELDKITTEKTGLGETGEVYIVNREKELISSSKFIENSILVQKVDTINSRNCLRMVDSIHEGHKAVTSFLDYRGVKVFGTHSYIPEMEWCVLAEIDGAEALEIPRAKLISMSLIIIIIVTTFVTLLGYIVGIFLEKKYKIKEKLLKERK